MKGFIEVTKGKEKVLINVNHIIEVKQLNGICRMYMTLLDPSKSNSFKISETYDQVKDLISLAI